MKIVYIHTDPFPSPMAGSVFALSTAIGLAEAGHNTTLVMPSAGLSVAQAIAYYGRDLPANLRVILPAAQAFGVGPLRFTWNGPYYRAVLRLLETELREADAAIVRTLKLASFLVERRSPIPIFYEMHDWYADVRRKWAGAEWMISAKKLRDEMALEKMERATAPRVAGLITLRRATAAVVRESYPSAVVETIPTGLNAPSRLPAVSEDCVAVYAGQLHPHKGFDVLFEAARLTPEMRLLIIGGGPWLAHWTKSAQQLGIANRVSFTGHLPSAQVPEYLAQGRVGVLPLLDCFFNRYLTSPLKIMEYYAAGLPVVTPDAPVTAEVVEHEVTGLLVPFGDAQALADAIMRLCADRDLHARCRENIAARLPEMSWKRRGEKIGAFVARVRK